MSHSVATRLRSPIQTLCRRSSSATATRGIPRLPEKKLRALVSLYHQTDTFITPENLSDRIDDAFITNPSTSTLKSTISYDLLKEKNARESEQPEFWEWEKDGGSLKRGGANDGKSWVESPLTDREAMVMEALYGVDTNDPRHRRLPGLDVLNDPETVSSDEPSSKP